MIRRLIRQMLTAQILSALTVSLCLLIDNVMIGRFLKENALAAYSLANPLLLGIGAIGTLLAAGIQVSCSKSLGRGSREETNAGYSSALAVTGAVSLLFMTVVLLCSSQLAHLLGAGRSGELYDETRGYIAGFSIGAPASMGALILIPFLQMGGQGSLLIVAVAAMTVTDVALDLLNVFVFHGGMFGMGLASAISYYVAMIVAAFYFLSRKCAFRFSGKLVSRRKILELFREGIPAGFNMLSSVIMVYIMNRILRGTGGSAAIAAYAVVSAIGNASNCITTGIGGVSLTLTGIFFHEEDRTSLKTLISQLCRASVVLGLGMGALLLIFAPACVSLFIPEEGNTQQMAILGLRIFAAGLIPCCLNNAFKNAWQATGRRLLTELTSLAEGAVFPSLAALLCCRFMGTTGAWLFFALGELITLLAIVIMTRKRMGQFPWQQEAGLLLKPDFGALPEDLMERDIRDMREVSETAEQAERFCLSRGQSPRMSSHIALCIEEMAANTIEHGFPADGKEHHLSVRVLKRGPSWILRFRDDCGAFDPVHYVPEEGKSNLGIRLAMTLAEEANYTYSLNLNNLMLKLRGEEAAEDGKTSGQDGTSEKKGT